MRTLLAEACPPGWSALPQARAGSLRPGWIKGSRLRAILKGGIAEIAAVANAPAELGKIRRDFTPWPVFAWLDNLVEVGVVGMVIATPGAWAAEEVVPALERGKSIEEKAERVIA